MSQPITSDTIVKHADKVIWNRIDDDAIVLNLKTGYYYTLNSVGRDMWKLFDGEHTVRDIGMALCKEYDVDLQQIELDILALLRDCKNEHLITIV